MKCQLCLVSFKDFRLVLCFRVSFFSQSCRSLLFPDAFTIECPSCPPETTCFRRARKIDFYKCPFETKCFAQDTKRATESGKGRTEEEVRTDVGGWPIIKDKFYNIVPKIYTIEERKKLDELILADVIKSCGINEGG